MTCLLDTRRPPSSMSLQELCLFGQHARQQRRHSHLPVRPHRSQEGVPTCFAAPQDHRFHHHPPRFHFVFSPPLTWPVCSPPLLPRPPPPPPSPTLQPSPPPRSPPPPRLSPPPSGRRRAARPLSSVFFYGSGIHTKNASKTTQLPCVGAPSRRRLPLPRRLLPPRSGRHSRATASRSDPFPTSRWPVLRMRPKKNSDRLTPHRADVDWASVALGAGLVAAGALFFSKVVGR